MLRQLLPTEEGHNKDQTTICSTLIHGRHLLCSIFACFRPLPVHGCGDQERSYLYVGDVADAFDVILHRGKKQLH